MALTGFGRSYILGNDMKTAALYVGLALENNTELSGNGYSRAQVPNAKRAVAAGKLTLVVAGTPLTVYTAGSATKQDANHWALFDAATAGNRLMDWEDASPDVGAPTEGQAVNIAPVNLTLAVSVLTNDGLAYILNNDMRTAALFVALGDSSSAEISGSGYARVGVANTNRALGASDGKLTLATAAKPINIYTATDASAPDADHIALFDSVTGGKRLTSWVDLNPDVGAPANQQIVRLTNLALTLAA